MFNIYEKYINISYVRVWIDYCEAYIVPIKTYWQKHMKVFLKFLWGTYFTNRD